MYTIILAFIFLFFIIYLLFLLQKENTLYNVPIYYINLDKSINRNKLMIEQLTKYNIKNYKRIRAVSPQVISTDNKKIYSQVCPYQNELEFACLLSHLKTIHTAYMNNNKYALILEDDVIIHRMVDFNNLLKTTPNDWEILQLHVLNADVYDKNKSLWIPYKQINWSMAAYLINRKGMEHVLSECFTNYKTDNFEELKINWDTFSKLQPCVSDFTIYNIAKVYSCNDLLFRVPTEESTIHNHHLPIHKGHEDKTIEFFY